MSRVINIQQERLQQLKIQLHRVADKVDISDASFAGLIYNIVSYGHVSEQQFRDEFGLSSEAVQRWTTEKNLPQPNVRPVILSWVLEQLS